MSFTECHVSYFNEGLTFDPDQQCYADGTTVTLSCPGNIGGPTSNQCSSGSWILPSATCEGIRVWSHIVPKATGILIHTCRWTSLYRQRKRKQTEDFHVSLPHIFLQMFFINIFTQCRNLPYLLFKGKKYFKTE